MTSPTSPSPLGAVGAFAGARGAGGPFAVLLQLSSAAHSSES